MVNYTLGEIIFELVCAVIIVYRALPIDGRSKLQLSARVSLHDSLTCLFFFLCLLKLIQLHSSLVVSILNYQSRGRGFKPCRVEIVSGFWLHWRSPASLAIMSTLTVGEKIRGEGEDWLRPRMPRLSKRSC